LLTDQETVHLTYLVRIYSQPITVKKYHYQYINTHTHTHTNKQTINKH